MTVNEIVGIISNVGFPIACVIIMFFQNTKHIDKMTEAVNNNTRVLERLCGIIGIDMEKITSKGGDKK